MVRKVAIEDNIFQYRGMGGETVIIATKNEIKDIKQSVTVILFLIKITNLQIIPNYNFF